MTSRTRQSGAGYRLTLVYALVALSVAALLWRVVDLHVVQRDTLRRRGLELARRLTWQRTAEATLEAYRQVGGGQG